MQSSIMREEGWGLTEEASRAREMVCCARVIAMGSRVGMLSISRLQDIVGHDNTVYDPGF